MKSEINICWLRRDLRLEDNAALYEALRSPFPVLLLFIFDKNILSKLTDKTDARVTFIHQTLNTLNSRLQKSGSSILTRYGSPEEVWPEILNSYTVKSVYTNHDYEPYARERDDALAEYLRSEQIGFHTFKDQVIFEKNEITKADGKPYTVFTPYFRQWQQKLNEFYVKAYPIEKYAGNFLPLSPQEIPSLFDMGFETSDLDFPKKDFSSKLDLYEDKRDFPAEDATTYLGIHLRFGTLSIREAARAALAQKAEKWLSELAWRDFYMMILWHFPHTVSQSFKPAYDLIKWRNDESEFEAWCQGNTGYPIVDAGMRQLNKTGYMHNRVRMIVASFLTKHLLVDWRWGEAYFAEKLLDYEMASNIGGWQWACGSGNDAAPYFRIFNPELQTKKFDPEFKYIDRWLPAYKQQKHVQPIVEHAFARERVLKVFKEALNE
ncbi:deoxyribodipyrimidine photo-lyase [Pedobacter steynii]|uniref:Deoxyribodipyrimidine photo-lyase n=1 Tax=Pedobacter steynii TaxID=430522 RepID=A0A1G9X1R8_9SPHI|nr:deoxyribodipyrimidine photo-lyase [Pedobacter steynii]NQX40459.1 deoxyribodipyrimidine photo-lyase [Pedobacter steynii]SDM90627.1 deoxyribodipyrimidine photo-lyase [Pedobacter steynii]